jgi:hypothetical protein
MQANESQLEHRHASQCRPIFIGFLYFFSIVFVY